MFTIGTLTCTRCPKGRRGRDRCRRSRIYGRLPVLAVPRGGGIVAGADAAGDGAIAGPEGDGCAGLAREGVQRAPLATRGALLVLVGAHSSTNQTQEAQVYSHDGPIGVQSRRASGAPV
eukprot:1773501-Pyramimonas_sp.AAC.1